MLTDFAETRAEYRAWREAITHTHERVVWARVLDLEHRRLAHIDEIIDGQVTIDVKNREVSRIANVTLLDPTQSIGWEPDSPSSLPIHLRRMVQIFDGRMVPDYGLVSCPVFCGPVSDFDRNGAEVSLSLEGKDRLAMRSFGRSHSWSKGRRITEVISEILELAGEAPSRIHVPNLPATLAKPLNVTRTDKPLREARRLSHVLNCVLIWDGRGHARVRRMPTKPTLTLDSDLLMGPVSISRPKVVFHNRWILLGKKPGGNKPRIKADLSLPKNNPFSAYQLRREGKWGWEIWQDERPQVATNARALEIVRHKRDEAIRSTADVSLDCLPFPNIEEWDLYRTRDPLTGVATTRVQQATIPLVSGVQTIGSLKRISRVRRRGGYHPAQHGGL